MRLATTLTLCLIGTSALADGCGQWSAKMEEDEGGPVMTAMICAPADTGAKGSEHLLLITCGGDSTLSMRFLPVTSAPFPPGGNEEFRSAIDVSADGKSFSIAARYEAMDGAMASSVKIGAPLIEAMMNGESVAFSDPAGIVPRATFSLEGSRRALQKVIGTCTK